MRTIRKKEGGILAWERGCKEFVIVERLGGVLRRVEKYTKIVGTARQSNLVSSTRLRVIHR